VPDKFLPELCRFHGSRLHTGPCHPKQSLQQRVQFLRLSRQDCWNIKSPQGPRCEIRTVLASFARHCNSATRDILLWAIAILLIGSPICRLYCDNTNGPRLLRKRRVIEWPRGLGWMDNDILGNDSGVVAAGSVAQFDCGRAGNTPTGAVEQRHSVGLVRVAALLPAVRNRCCRLSWWHGDVRRQEMHYENTGSDRAENDVEERRCRGHGSLLLSERLAREPLCPFNTPSRIRVPGSPPLQGLHRQRQYLSADHRLRAAILLAAGAAIPPSNRQESIGIRGCSERLQMMGP
jgi:hypothetical protein